MPPLKIMNARSLLAIGEWMQDIYLISQLARNGAKRLKVGILAEARPERFLGPLESAYLLSL
jgi:hypothetical protein